MIDIEREVMRAGAARRRAERSIGADQTARSYGRTAADIRVDRRRARRRQLVELRSSGAVGRPRRPGRQEQAKSASTPGRVIGICRSCTRQRTMPSCRVCERCAVPVFAVLMAGVW